MPITLSAVFCVKRLSNQTCGIGEVDEPGVRRDSFDCFCVGKRYRQRTKRHSGATGPGRFLTRKPMIDRDSLIARTGRHAADSDAVQDERGTRYRALKIGRFPDLEEISEGAQNFTAEAANDVEAPRIGIEQSHFGRAQLRLCLS